MRERELSKRSLRAHITRIDSAGLECEKVANAIIACGDGGGRKMRGHGKIKLLVIRPMRYDLGDDNRIRSSAVSRKDNKICLRVRMKSLGSFFIVSLSILLSLSSYTLTHPARPSLFAFSRTKFDGSPSFSCHPVPSA
jgi:hypothetical protein